MKSPLHLERCPSHGMVATITDNRGTTLCQVCGDPTTPVSYRYKIAKAVVTNKNADTIEGVLLDTYTAAAMVAVFEAMGDEQREKFDLVPLERLASFCLSRVLL